MAKNPQNGGGGSNGSTGGNGMGAGQGLYVSHLLAKLVDHTIRTDRRLDLLESRQSAFHQTQRAMMKSLQEVQESVREVQTSVREVQVEIKITTAALKKIDRTQDEMLKHLRNLDTRVDRLERRR